jgi:hypothetical protein
MRTTINLSDDILIEAKSIAVRSGRTLTDVIEEAVRESLARRRASGERHSLSRPRSFGEGGLRPGIDLDDSAALLDIMDGTDR